MISSAISIFTDLTQIQVKCPFNYGILDGLLILLNQMINQVNNFFLVLVFDNIEKKNSIEMIDSELISMKGEQMIADQFLETQLWDMLWARVSQSLKPQPTQSNEQMVGFSDAANMASNNALTGAEVNQDGQQILMSSSIISPDWVVLSPNGYISILQLASKILTMSTQNCINSLIREDSSMFDSLSYMLSDRFLLSLKKK